MDDALRTVGRPVSRVEARDKVTGSARYAADVAVPGLVHAALVQSEIPHGRVTPESMACSARRAAAAPGVRGVLTPLDPPVPHAPPTELSDDLPVERRPPLADLDVEHVGQHLALVVADTLEEATYAASLFDLEYVAAPAQLTARDVVGQPSRPEDDTGSVRRGTYRPDHFVKLLEEKLQDHRGPLTAPAEGTRVAAHFTTPRNAHYPIELASTIAHWEGESLTIHDSTRWILGERRVVAACLGIPEDRVRVLSPLVGGAFGSKNFLWMHVVLCAAAAREVGRPVKLVLTRNQMFSSTGHRPRTEQDVTLVADDAGRITSTEHTTLSETSSVAQYCEPAGLSARILYESPRLVVSHTVARVNAPTPCFMRGPGEAPGLFALEVAMDELAYACDLDPVELRIVNHAKQDQATGRPWSGNHLLECYREGAARFGWGQRPMAPRSLQRGCVQVGWGMATATYPGRRMPAGCQVTTSVEGAVRFAAATHEVGNGVRTVMTQIAADATGLPMTAVSFASGDSDFAEAPYSGASQTTASVGSAVLAAATEWRRRLLDLAADGAGAAYGHDPSTLDIVDGRVVSTRDASLGIPVSDLLRSDPRLLDALGFTVTSGGAPEDGPVSQSFGAHFCEVEVDESIGRASVVRWVAVLDGGRVLNPKLARSQVVGGITFGLGMALLEQVEYDARSAQLIGEYYLPTHADRPDFDISFVDVADPGLGPVGARGIGELGGSGVAAAVSNAVFHATGKRLRDLPITVEDLMSPFDPAPATGRPA